MSKLINIQIIKKTDTPPVSKNFIVKDTSIFRSTYAQVEQLNKDAALKALKALGAASMTVEYSGSGDSGQIDAVTFFDKDEVIIKTNMKIDIGEYSLTNDSVPILETDIPKSEYLKYGHVQVIIPNPRPENWKYPASDNQKHMKEFIKGTLDTNLWEPKVRYNRIELKYFTRSAEDVGENLGYSLITIAGHSGYENNDGGSGTITYNFETGQGKVNHEDYYTASEEFETEFKETA